MRRYARLLRPPPHHRPFVAATVGRLAISMGPLSVVLGVGAITGSYTAAGVVAAALAAGFGAGAPVLGRLVDRFGQRRVVACGAVVSGSATYALALATVGGVAVPGLVALAFVAGAALPPLSACMRAAWQSLVTSHEDREAAYALEAVAIELIFIFGPILVGLLLLTPVRAAPLLATATATLGGGLAYAVTTVAGAWRPDSAAARQRPRGGALRGPGVRATLASFALVSVAFGTLDVSLAATADRELGNEALVGVLFTAVAGGSLLGGLWYGGRHFFWAQRRRLLVTLGVFALGLSPLSLLTGNLPLLLLALAVAGVGIAPTSIVSHQLLDDTAPPGTRTEAQAWSSTANTAGAAAGTALAGVLVDLGGPAYSLRAAPVAILGALVVALACQRLLVEHAGPSPGPARTGSEQARPAG